MQTSKSSKSSETGSRDRGGYSSKCRIKGFWKSSFTKIDVKPVSERSGREGEGKADADRKGQGEGKGEKSKVTVNQENDDELNDKEKERKEKKAKAKEKKDNFRTLCEEARVSSKTSFSDFTK